MSKTPQQLEKERREDVSAAVVSSVVGARFRRRDVGGRQVHDFDLEFPDGAVEALEICTLTDGTVREQWQILDGLDEVATQLTSAWTISIVRGARVKLLPKKVEPHLATLERHDLWSFDAADHYRLGTRDASADLIAASAALIELGVIDAVRVALSPGEPARVVIAAGTGGATTGAVISRVVQQVASKRDNRLKLQAATQARRRHILVPIDPSAGAVWSVARDAAGREPPRLPSGVTVAWVIGANGSTFRAELPDAWTAVEVDQRVWDDPAHWRA